MRAFEQVLVDKKRAAAIIEQMKERLDMLHSAVETSSVDIGLLIRVRLFETRRAT